MFVVLLLVAALAPCLAVLAVLGHGPARRLQLSRYVLLSCASWLAASVCLFAMASLLSGSSGSATDLPIVREPRAFVALAAVACRHLLWLARSSIAGVILGLARGTSYWHSWSA
jgi:hypothetical protein